MVWRPTESETPDRRVNAICRQFGNDQVIILSIHVNAAENGQNWLDARGWNYFTTRGKTKADAPAIHLDRRGL